MTRDIKISAAEHCYRTLSRKIIGLELKPNEPIGEHALAGLLGVSRTPVREALSRLSAEGLVDLRSRAGVVVAPIRMDAVRTAQFVREQLELAIVAEAAQQSNRRVLLGIRQAIEEQELAILEDNPDLFFECDERMHALYCSLAGRDGLGLHLGCQEAYGPGPPSVDTGGATRPTGRGPPARSQGGGRRRRNQGPGDHAAASAARGGRSGRAFAAVFVLFRVGCRRRCPLGRFSRAVASVAPPKQIFAIRH